jgi:hypothetical protein
MNDQMLCQRTHISEWLATISTDIRFLLQASFASTYASRGGGDFPHPSRPTLQPTQRQPPIQCLLGLSWGIKQLGHGIDHPPPYSTEVKGRVELYLYSTSGPSWSVIGWTLPCLHIERSSWSKQHLTSGYIVYCCCICVDKYLLDP